MGVFRTLLLLLLLMAGSAAPAQQTSSSEYRMRAESLIGLFNGSAKPEDMFSPAFLAQVPPAQVNAITKQLTGQYGAARAVAKIDAAASTSGTVSVDFEKGRLQVRMVIGATAPHLIEGLLVTGGEMKGDTLAAVVGEVKALPGRTNLAISRLGDGLPIPVLVHESARPMAIGSTFKLFLLAELSRSVKAGERKWADVVQLNRRSLPSGFLQSWPEGAPMTLHSLAALMISQSDNTATDTLLHVLGRERVERLLPALGVKAPERNRPFLSTLEAFALKAGTGEAAKSWAGAGEARRRALLANYASLSPTEVPLENLAGPPKLIDTVEWFASADDLVRTMDWLRRNGGPEVMQILAINSGIGPAAAAEHAYLGYKGGSETGVMNMAFLLRSKSGQWHAISGGWNNAEAAVDEAKFVSLMARLVALLR